MLCSPYFQSPRWGKLGVSVDAPIIHCVNIFACIETNSFQLSNKVMQFSICVFVSAKRIQKACATKNVSNSIQPLNCHTSRIVASVSTIKRLLKHIFSMDGHVLYIVVDGLECWWLILIGWQSHQRFISLYLIHDAMFLWLLLATFHKVF